MENKLGTSAFCGVGASLETIYKHLEDAANCGVEVVFTSLQLPEADKDVVLNDFPKVAEYAHKLGLKIDTDLSKKTADYYGIDYKNIKEIKKMGVDIARLDYGFKLEETAALTFNEEGIMIEMNATHVTEAKLKELASYPLNKDNIRFCHNYYPLPLTGQTYEETKELNALIHKYGFKVMGFIPSNTHHRIGCGAGLPTIEDQRNQPTHINVQEGYLCGFDDICFGDDLASKEELEILAKYKKGETVFRMKPCVDDAIIEWLETAELLPWRYNLDKIIRQWKGCGYQGNVDNIPATKRPRGTVAVCKANGDYRRYRGELIISKVDLPYDENYATIGHILEEDFPLIDKFTSVDNNFKIEIVK